MNLRHLRPGPSFTGGLLLFVLAALPVDARHEWVDTGATFAAGTLGHSGQNLFVNRHGELEIIRRYDLDGDGRLDLLFNSTHDTYNALPATMVTASGRTLQTAELGVDGSSRIIAHDLNRDGYDDLVFMPNPQNVQQQRSSIIIAWGADNGWSASRLTRQLPVEGITSLAVGDLNGDGWPDLLTLNGEGWLHGQPEGRIVRAYWGSEDGFFLSRYQDLGIPGAIEITTGGFGAEREFSCVVLTGDGALHFLAKDPEGEGVNAVRTLVLPFAPREATAKAQMMIAQSRGPRSGDALWISTNTTALFHVDTAGAEPVIESISAQPATHLALGRLDGDEWPDLVLTSLNLIFPSSEKSSSPDPSVNILWGGSEGVDIQRRTALSIPNAFSTAIGDLDGDGRGDLLVAVHQGEESMKASSRVYFGDGSRRFSHRAAPVATEGAQGVAIARVTSDSDAVAIFANSQHRTLDDAVPLRLYWGVPGGFSPEVVVDIPNLSGYKSSASDLNGDGYVDLIVINGGDISDDAAARAPETGINIYWGGREGRIRGPGPTRFDASHREVLHEKHLGSINVADLNRDGYLDLVLGAFESTGHPDTDLVIHYGSAEGFLPSNRKTVPVPGRSIGCLIADYDRDGHLDIIIGSYTTDQVITYWGEAGAYSDRNKTVLPYPAPIDLEAADLNQDGWLDLLVASYRDSVAQHHDTGSSIFWGGRAGWHQSNSQWLPGMTPVGLAVADLDQDGHLDIISPHYHGELSREQLPSYIFWGSPEGYAPQNRASLIVNSASEVVVGDFNQDGRPDLAFAAHSVDPGHLLDTPVFFNDGHRFAAPEVQYLPVIGPHYMWVQDIGNIYHRRHEETFTSRILTWEGPSDGGRIAIDAATPFGSRIALQVRSARNESALDAASWRDVANGALPLSASDRALQYRLVLHSVNGDAYPRVRQVGVTLR